MGFLSRLGGWSAFTAVASLASAGSTDAGLIKSDPNYFPIGVWQQPTNTFDKWESRGINLLLATPEGHDVKAWSDAAVRSGLYIIREPDNGTNEGNAKSVAAARAADLRRYRSNLLAWSLKDEPDFNETAQSALRREYAALKAVDTKNPQKVLMNFSGATVLGADTRAGNKVPDVRYERYTQATDWVSSDIYPVTGWGRPDWIDYDAKAADRKTPGKAMDKLRQLSGGKPQIAIIETSDQNLAWASGAPGVDRHQFRGQVWHSIIHGAEGIVYFPFKFNSFSFDATPPDVAAEMAVQNRRIQGLASVINAKRDPKDLSFVAGSKKASRLLEASWRHGKGADYFFVLNMSGKSIELPFDLVGVKGTGVVVDEDRALRMSERGTYSDRFDPWEMHVYKFAHPVQRSRMRLLGLESAPVPEPSFGAAALVAGTLLMRRRRRR